MMDLQEWFITHPWAYYLYWILGIIFLIIIYKLPDVEHDGHELIIRLPHSLSGSFESKQRLKERDESLMMKHRIDLFGELMETNKVRNYGIGSKPDVPSKFWPDAESNAFDEITNWKNDLRKEQQGQTDFHGSWGMGSSFEKKIDIDLLLRAFYNVNGEYSEKEAQSDG